MKSASRVCMALVKSKGMWASSALRAARMRFNKKNTGTRKSRAWSSLASDTFIAHECGSSRPWLQAAALRGNGGSSMGFLAPPPTARHLHGHRLRRSWRLGFACCGLDFTRVSPVAGGRRTDSGENPARFSPRKSKMEANGAERPSD